VELTLGPDLAKPLRPVWSVIENHADRLDRLARQLAQVRFDVVPGKEGPALAMLIATADHNHTMIRVVLDGKTVRYFCEAGEQAFQADLPAAVGPDQGVYLLLAELAARW
jgi:hypothetical protein